MHVTSMHCQLSIASSHMTLCRLMFVASPVPWNLDLTFDLDDSGTYNYSCCCCHCTDLKIWSCVFEGSHSGAIEGRVSSHFCLASVVLLLRHVQHSTNSKSTVTQPYLLKLLLPVVLSFIHDVNAVGQRGYDTSSSGFEGNGLSFEVHCAEICVCSTPNREVRGVASGITTPSSKLCWSKSKRVRASPAMPCLRVEPRGQR